MTGKSEIIGISAELLEKIHNLWVTKRFYRFILTKRMKED
ncbi:hypothetical protein LEP1GSC018_3125 [Leptospira kirschneri str. 2008720114]|nr:hypothetical protein LEP1GSC018_3125 [Leptospira kirschneri str. 2008720114]